MPLQCDLTNCPTGLCDSLRRPIKIGDLVKRTLGRNNPLHGPWLIHRVKAHGLVPIVSYYISAKGQVLPEGATACCLSDLYDLKSFLFAYNPSVLMPDEMIVVVDEEEFKATGQTPDFPSWEESETAFDAPRDPQEAPADV
jgi:hypothetical protein